MILQKQKSFLLNVSAKFGKKLMVWHILSLELPIILVIAAFVLVSYTRPLPTNTTTYSRTSISEIRKKSTLPKDVHSTVDASKVITTSPTPPLSQPVKAPVQAGTPKQEPIVTPSPSSSVSGLTPTTTSPAPSPQPTAPTPTPSSQPTTTGYTSTNWSGYLATNGRFTGVSGSWTATNAAGNGVTTSADATWIGIGGVTTNDLIQVGTENTISASGQVSTSAFYELLPNVSQPVPGVIVLPGDSITASLFDVSGDQWTISITDKTDGQSDTFNVFYNSSLSSAEWIEEDPSYSFGRQIPFDNFFEAVFTNASTILNSSATTISASTAQPVSMVDKNNQILAKPSVIGNDGASFTVIP